MSIDGPSYDYEDPKVASNDTKEAENTIFAMNDTQRYVLGKPNDDVSSVEKKESVYDKMNTLEESKCNGNIECINNVNKVENLFKVLTKYKISTDMIEYTTDVLDHYDEIPPKLAKKIMRHIDKEINKKIAELKKENVLDTKTLRFIEATRQKIHQLIMSIGLASVVATGMAAPSFAKEPTKYNKTIKNPSEIWVVNNDGQLWFNGRLNLWSSDIFGQIQTDPDNFWDNWGASASYVLWNEYVWGGLWLWHSTKKGIWDINSITGWVYAWKDVYGSFQATGSKFSPESGTNLAESEELQALLGAWINITENLNIDGGCWVSSVSVEWYDRDNNTICKLWTNYALPGWVTISWGYENKGWDDKYMVNLSWSFGWGKSTGKTNFAKRNLWYGMVERTAHFNDNMVKTKKEPTPEVVPWVSTPSLNAIWPQLENDNGGWLPTTLNIVSGTGIEPGATYAITNNPTLADAGSDSWLTIDTTTWVMTLDIDVNPTKTYTGIEITVTNPDGGTATQTFDLTVIDNL
jgi:hypothetical protein